MKAAMMNQSLQMCDEPVCALERMRKWKMNQLAQITTAVKVATRVKKMTMTMTMTMTMMKKWRCRVRSMTALSGKFNASPTNCESEATVLLVVRVPCHQMYNYHREMIQIQRMIQRMVKDRQNCRPRILRGSIPA